MKAAIPTHNLDLLFGALANEHRREIIYSLGLQPSSISRLASLRGLSLPAIHKHITVLEADQTAEVRASQFHHLK
jgi:predicted transcriptional regulator